MGQRVPWTRPARPRRGNGTCDNEDLNRNGVLEVYQQWRQVEDANSTGFLEPRKADVAISFDGASSTNSDGQVVLKITYPQSIASWLEFNILVAACGVAGTEGRTSYRACCRCWPMPLPTPRRQPAFGIGPYGVYASPIVPTTNPAGQTGLLCTNPN